MICADLAARYDLPTSYKIIRGLQMSSGVGYLGSDLKYKKKTLESSDGPKIVGYSGRPKRINAEYSTYLFLPF